jgi:hypothetical protein
MPASGDRRSYYRLGAGAILLMLMTFALMPALAGATGLSSRTLQLFNSEPGQATDYNFSFTISNNATVGSLGILFCSNDPVEDDPCTLPSGLDDSNAQLTAQTGITDFNLFVAASNSLVLSRTPSAITAPLNITLNLHNIINPTVPGPYYVRLAVYSSSNATGSSVDFGGLAFAATSNVQISSVVPPYLTFCSGLVISNFNCASAAGDYIDLGNLSSSRSSQASSQLLVATNAPNGYMMQVYGTTMTSGNNTINPIIDNSGSRPGSQQFGINLRANTIPVVGADPAGPGSGQPVGAYANPNRFQFISNDVIADSPNADDYRKYTVSYLVNTAAGQPPGVYASTLTYVAAGSF